MTWQDLEGLLSIGNAPPRPLNSPHAERFDEVFNVSRAGLAPVRRDGAAWHIHPMDKPPMRVDSGGRSALRRAGCGCRARWLVPCKSVGNRCVSSALCLLRQLQCGRCGGA